MWTGSIPRIGTGLIFLALIGPPPSRGAEGEPWAGTWAAAPQLVEPNNMPPAPGLADATLRQVVRGSLGGRRVRVRFSNAFGAGGLTILAAHLAPAGEAGAIRPGTGQALRFAGRPAVTIPPGALMITDPVDLDLAPLADLAVTIHVRDPTTVITGHPGARCTSFLGPGDWVAAIELPAGVVRTPHWYYLSGIDVAGPPAAAVAVLGDSITDGRGSPTDGNGRWTDHLARRLRDDPPGAPIGVLNQGLGGNRVLADGLGPGALARLDRDVLAQPGVRWLIVLEGINDLGTRSASARDLIAAYDQMIQRAHARNIRVYGATILPCGASFYANAELEAARQEINTWVRTAGRFDAVIDFDAATRDPRAPERLAPAVDGGDHLHPGPAGYKIMADAVDLGLFRLAPLP